MTSSASDDEPTPVGAHAPSVSDLKAISADVESALERVRVPAYVIDRHGIIRWINSAAKKIVGDVRGQQLTSVLAARGAASRS